MLINGLGAVNQVYKTNSTYKTNRAASAYSSDKVELSSFGKELQIAKAAVSAASDVREDKIADIKARMSAGTYNVTGMDFANKIVDNYSTKLDL